jgi:hypothetical protein
MVMPMGRTQASPAKSVLLKVSLIWQPDRWRQKSVTQTNQINATNPYELITDLIAEACAAGQDVNELG